MEIWKDIPKYEGLYQVSNFGNVKSLDRIVKGKNNIERKIKGKIILPFKGNGGYLCVRLWKNNFAPHFKVHRLILSTFYPIKNMEIYDVNHIDGNKQNNHINNLEWCTRQENLIHAVENGLNKQCISIKATKNNKEYTSKSISGMYKKLSNNEIINCKEKTFKENVRRALNTNGMYYGYTFSKVVIH